MKILFIAWKIGVQDGFAQPFDLTSGMSWENNEAANLWYDRGANLGQFLGKIFNRGSNL